MKQRIKLGLLSVLFSGLLFTGCETYPGYNDYVTDQLVAITNYDTNANFKSYQTYAIYDSAIIVDNGVATRVKIGDPKYPNLSKFKDQVKANMTSIAGYTYTESPNADLGVMLSYVENTTVYIQTYPWWWYDYCDWYFWNCPYYPYYPYPYPVVYGGYTVGSGLIDMFDLKAKNSQNNKISAVWTAVVRGLYTNDHTEAQINSAITDCFNQTIPFQK